MNFGTVQIVEQETMQQPIKSAGSADTKRNSQTKKPITSTSNCDKRQHWIYSQQEYVSWTNNRLKQGYINDIVQLGRKFQQFIGPQQRCLDIGCGNGLISGRYYKDIGYQYLDRGAVGIDPLVLQGPKPPWIKEYIRAISEHLPFKNECFDTLVFATTLDHVEDVDSCLEECRRILRKDGTVNIWLTCRFDDNWPKGKSHANYFTQPRLENLVNSHGFEIVDRLCQPWEGVGSNGVIITSGNTVFIKAKKGE